MSNISLAENLAKISNLVDPYIKELLATDIEDTDTEIAFYQCSVGGKKIRPALVLLCGQLFGADIYDLLYPAASVEILHNATLIVDDIIDKSGFRRNQPTCWNKFGQSVAECNVIVYIASVYSGLNHSKNSQRLVNLYSKTIKVMADGEIKDILFERSGHADEPYIVQNRYPEVTTDDYLGMINQKTAILLQTACMTGAICADASEEQITAIGDFGLNLGMAFQIRDDMLDIFGDEKEFGKKVGQDIIEKTLGNYVILSAMDQMDVDDKELIQNLLSSPNEITDTDIAQVISIIKKTNARQDAEDASNSYIQKAFACLDKLPQNEFTGQLHQIANYVVDRKK